MMIKEIYQDFLQQLKGLYGTGEATAITNMVFENFCNLRKSDIITKENEPVDDKTLKDLQLALPRLLNYEPLQYIIGKAWFYNVAFEVNKDVLIPRPETEELVLEAINFLQTHATKNVIDIGTGSGCIPISIKKNITNTEVIGIDVSMAAIAVAKRNSIANEVNIDFRNIDFLVEENYNTLPKFDLIISNPPYIPEEEKTILDKNVTLHEPHIALFVPQHDALIFYKKIALFADTHLNNNGKIMVEIHENLAKETAAIFTEKKYVVEIKKDMQGKERMLIIYRYP